VQIYAIKNKTGMTNFPNVMGKNTISKKIAPDGTKTNNK
jgi:hypothetical protein